MFDADITQKRTFGQMHKVTESILLHDVHVTNDGSILICTNDGLHVLDGNTKMTTKIIGSGYSAFGITSFEDGFMVCLMPKESYDSLRNAIANRSMSTQIVRLNQQYEEVKTWTLAKPVRDLAVADGKAYLSLARPAHSPLEKRHCCL